jgi:hypothetical protein
MPVHGLPPLYFNIYNSIRLITNIDTTPAESRARTNFFFSAGGQAIVFHFYQLLGNTNI